MAFSDQTLKALWEPVSTVPPVWRYAAASVSGAAHVARSIESQDAFHSNIADVSGCALSAADASTPIVIAVADGAGSSPYSAAGANIAAGIAHRTALDAAQRIPWSATTTGALRAAMNMVFVRVRLRLRMFSNPTSIPAPDMQTTLQVVIYRPPWIVTAQVGDGFVVVESGGDRLELIYPADRVNEYANVTEFLNSERMPSVHVTPLCDPAVSGVAVSTDGLKDNVLEFAGGVPVRPNAGFFGPLFNEVGAGAWDGGRLMGLLRSDRMRKETDDDLTLVVMAAR